MIDRRLLFLGFLMLVCVICYMSYDIKGSVSFALTLRGEKLAGLVVVALSVSTATILFHTITGNRILTPSIMGFDELYKMILSIAIFALGSQSYLAIPAPLLFVINSFILVMVSFALFGTLLFSKQSTDIMRMVLTGIIVGVLFRSLSYLVQRMIDPNEFSIIATQSFANFSSLDADLLLISALVCFVCMGMTWRMRHQLDILALGTDAATNLGLRPRKTSLQALALMSILVCTSTALVGPVAFLGLVVVNIAHLVTPSPYHSKILISSGLVSIITLVGGQAIMERVMRYETPLSVVIDMFGGLLFLILVIRQAKR